MYVPFEGGVPIRNRVASKGYTFITGIYRMICNQRMSIATLVSTWIVAVSLASASASLLSSNLFPADNPWNQNISQAPVATNSAAIISKIGNGRFHPDFGQDYRARNGLYGIPYNVVHGHTTPKIH